MPIAPVAPSAPVAPQGPAETFQQAQQPMGPPGYSQPGYQAPYRPPRVPFAGNLLDHPPFIVSVVLAFISSASLVFAGVDPQPIAGSPVAMFTSLVVIFLFELLFFVAGVIGLAGCIGVWRFREWGRQCVVIGQAGFGIAGVMTLIAGGMNKEGAAAAIVLWGIVMIAISTYVIYYLLTDDVRSRMQYQ